MRVISRPFPAAAAPVLAAALLGAVVPSAGPVTAVQAAPAAASATYGELAENGTFASGTTGWWNSANASMAPVDGTLRASVGAGTVNPWDAVIGQDDIELRAGVAYTLSFDARSSVPASIRATVQMGADPFTAPLDKTIGLGTASQHFSWTFTSGVQAAGQITFQLGGQQAATDVVFDNVSLTTSTAREGFYNDPVNNAATWVQANRADPRATKIDAAIAGHNTVKWYGDWDADGNSATDIEAEVSNYVGAAAAKGQLPVVVAYNIPGRDCGGASSGGAGSSELYKAWIEKFARGIGRRPAIVILEPDAVAQAADETCMKGGTEERFDMLWYANQRFQEQGEFVQTYLDAGNAAWTLGDTGTGGTGIGLEKMAYLLNRSGVSLSGGVSVNVSNFDSTDVSNDYGRRLAARIQADYGVTVQWVVDTARNGNGGYVVPGSPISGHVGFCNPADRKLGVTSRAGEGGAEYLLWIKNPGDSDGDDPANCPAGSPPAGRFSPALAEALIDGN
ncbi:glycoside hydrolase family 6 protein [Streptomyces sp. CA-210063]|uniref:glycoside hydrolase family 6 protein n=1 Tax=Streptomyces sp. CA-210063 TaxID=2801029 RepID=UPI00214CCF5D|nr:glycoside hydrolase family 6 protein [Streptomyces sp. CA-210063]UUU31841.1 glycoside hydrolase family 6 protein [Streptomyces sp. CA-210063]